MSVEIEKTASGSGEPPEFVPPVETHLLRAKSVAQAFKIQVAQPLQKRGSSMRFPVVYVTDGNLLFDALKGISYSIQASGSHAPRFILVGIGYPGESPFAGSVLRMRDMTFPEYPRFSTKPPPLEGVLAAESGTIDYYGAEAFQEFIAGELIPWVEARYCTVASQRTYFGHSLGGGFGLFSLFTRSELFRNYIISSPGLEFHGESQPGTSYENHDFVLRYARRFVALGNPLHDVSVHMSVGTEEEFEPGGEAWQLTSSFYRLARVLKAAKIPGLELTVDPLPGETHMAAWPLAFMHGIRAVFGNRPRGE